MIAKIVWEDVDYWNDWIYPVEAIEYRDFLVTTYGKIIYEDEQRIIVACEEHPDGKRYAKVTNTQSAGKVYAGIRREEMTFGRIRDTKNSGFLGWGLR